MVEVVVEVVVIVAIIRILVVALVTVVAAVVAATVVERENVSRSRSKSKRPDAEVSCILCTGHLFNAFLKIMVLLRLPLNVWASTK